MKPHSPNPCPGCRRLEAVVDGSRAEMASLREQLAAAQKNSATSSKPPSSDIVKLKPAPPEGPAKRSIGGQPRHPKHERQPFPAKQVTHFETHVRDPCQSCGGSVLPSSWPDKVVQQVDVGRPPQTIEPHIRPAFWCDHSQRGFMAALRTHLERGGLVGPQLTALTRRGV